VRRATVVLLVLFAGCGGSSGDSSKDDFKKQFAPVDTELKAEGRDVAKAFETAKGKTDAELADAFDRLATRLDASISKLKAIKPTDALKADYARLQKQFTQVHKDLDDIASAARAHNAGTARTATERAVSDSAVIKKTANKVRKALGLDETF
jgi:hypothetical protein